MPTLVGASEEMPKMSASVSGWNQHPGPGLPYPETLDTDTNAREGLMSSEETP